MRKIPLKIFLLLLTFWPTFFAFPWSVIPLTPQAVLLKKSLASPFRHLIWLAVHENEFEAVKAMRWALKRYGGSGFQIVNLVKRNQRILTGFQDGKKYFYDPNRIFSHEGTTKNLHHYNLYLNPRHQKILGKALREIERVRKRFLQSMQITRGKVVISLHNNLNRGNFSIRLYQKKNRQGFEVYRHPKQHPKNFILVTEKKHFNFLKQRKINVVLQAAHSKRTNDGSLADYCKRHGYVYINIETRFGNLKTQKKLIQNVMEMLQQDFPEKP